MLHHLVSLGIVRWYQVLFFPNFVEKSISKNFLKEKKTIKLKNDLSKKLYLV